jgi:hypothetical protein
MRNLLGKRDLLPIDVALEPFSQTNLDKIFQLDPDHSDRIMSRESSWLEFKQNFNWASWEKYARTAAAFANARGGYIVFGIGNKPRKLTGMTNTNFEDTDPETITKDLNSSFAPALEWQSYVFFKVSALGCSFFGNHLLNRLSPQQIVRSSKKATYSFDIVARLNVSAIQSCTP